MKRRDLYSMTIPTIITTTLMMIMMMIVFLWHLCASNWIPCFPRIQICACSKSCYSCESNNPRWTWTTLLTTRIMPRMMRSKKRTRALQKTHTTTTAQSRKCFFCNTCLNCAERRFFSSLSLAFLHLGCERIYSDAASSIKATTYLDLKYVQ
jgi:hypothetical protein